MPVTLGGCGGFFDHPRDVQKINKNRPLGANQLFKQECSRFDTPRAVGQTNFLYLCLLYARAAAPTTTTLRKDIPGQPCGRSFCRLGAARNDLLIFGGIGGVGKKSQMLKIITQGPYMIDLSSICDTCCDHFCNIFMSVCRNIENLEMSDFLWQLTIVRVEALPKNTCLSICFKRFIGLFRKISSGRAFFASFNF